VQAWDSWTFNAVSFGMAKFPLWIPQGVMVLGLVIFWIALLDEALAVLRGQDPAFLRAEAEKQGKTDGH
jgi:hypothetical protein